MCSGIRINHLETRGMSVLGQPCEGYSQQDLFIFVILLKRLFDYDKLLIFEIYHVNFRYASDQSLTYMRCVNFTGRPHLGQCNELR